MNPVIILDQVCFGYTSTPVLKNISLQIEDKEFIGVVGPNAGGKSTLLKLILGLLEPDSGMITVLGKKPSAGRLDIGYVPQFPSFSRDFPINVLDLVLQGRLGETRLFGQYSKRDLDIAKEALHAVEVDSISHEYVRTLSGGQLQRVLIARALATHPRILILDEPTANIDFQVEENIFGLLKEYNDEMTIIVVSHDIAFISAYVDRVACLNRTLVCHATEDISGKTIDELYGTHVKMIQHTHKI